MENVLPILLIADDQPENLIVIKNILNQLDDKYTLITVPNGKILIDIAAKTVPDLIIVDWEMPEIDGLTAVKILKQNERTKDTPVIMYTGVMTSAENLKTSLEAGAVDFIRKPIDPIELVARVKSMLQLSNSFKKIKAQKQELEILNEEIEAQKQLLMVEKQKIDKLLLNILPEEVAEELKEKQQVTPKYYKQVSVLFADLRGFTKLSEQTPPQELISLLNYCFGAFDDICEKYNLEKIKTIGDAYMCAGGLPRPNTSNAYDIVSAGLAIQQFMKIWKKERLMQGLPAWEVRIGIHTGELLAGVIGTKKFAYDIWGDTVNIASRMESSGEVGQINISETTYELIKNDFKCNYRGELEVKGKGKMKMYFVTRGQQ